MAFKRQLAAIMFTDIVGFSQLLQSDEIKGQEALQRHQQTLQDIHAHFGGQLIQYNNDTGLSIFGSTAAAVECAVAIQVECRKEPPLLLRIGIHTGEITFDQQGAFGEGVNLAKLIEGLCKPGSVYVTEKVYDDIKRHPWLSSVGLGTYHPPQISHPIQVYAIVSKNLPIPSQSELSMYPAIQEPGNAEGPGHKKKGVATLLALFFGMFGVHRLYLGQRILGSIYLMTTISTILIVSTGGPPFIAFMGILVLIDTILLLAMPRVDFNARYNRTDDTKRHGLFQRVIKGEQVKSVAKSLKKSASKINKGNKHLAAGRYEEAIRSFDSALDINESDEYAHYQLAACFSMLKDADNAYFHLGEAVKYGFNDFKKIDSDINLYFLRSHPSYSRFRNRGYKVLGELPKPKEDLLESERFDPSILEKIEQLGSLYENGRMSMQEFQLQKEQILKGG